jgi:hypothetical protein
MPIRRWAFGLMLGLSSAILVTTSLVVTSAGTTGSNRAGLVIVHGNGQVTTRCLEFSETMITGLELLQRAEVDVNVDDTNQIGVAVCRIDNEGCSFPGEPCFCQCLDSPCTFWSYWQLTAGDAWGSSSMGAANREIHDGDTDGWVWGAGNTTTSNPPPAASFNEICAPPTPTNTTAATATNTSPPPTATHEPPTDTPPPAAARSLPPTATAAPPTNTAQPRISQPAPPTATAAPAAQRSIRAAGTPLITTPTALPAATEPHAIMTTPTLPVESAARAEAAPTRTGAAAGVPSPALLAKVVASPTSRPTRSGPTSAPLLAASPSRTPVPQAGPAASTNPPGVLLALGIGLTGAGVGGAALLVAKRLSGRPGRA